MYVYMWIYQHTYLCVYIYIYILCITARAWSRLGLLAANSPRRKDIVPERCRDLLMQAGTPNGARLPRLQHGVQLTWRPKSTDARWWSSTGHMNISPHVRAWRPHTDERQSRKTWIPDKKSGSQAARQPGSQAAGWDKADSLSARQPRDWLFDILLATKVLGWKTTKNSFWGNS